MPAVFWWEIHVSPIGIWRLWTDLMTLLSPDLSQQAVSYCNLTIRAVTGLSLSDHHTGIAYLCTCVLYVYVASLKSCAQISMPSWHLVAWFKFLIAVVFISLRMELSEKLKDRCFILLCNLTSSQQCSGSLFSETSCSTEVDTVLTHTHAHAAQRLIQCFLHTLY